MTRPRRQSCAQCHGEFAVSEKEVSLLEKVSPSFAGVTTPIPPPVLCPACREGSRLAFRNEWKMYRRQCDATGKSLVSIYRDDSPYRVVDPEWWWSDAYDPLDYGRDFDFSRSFFEQFHELNLAVPKSAIQNAKSENADYTNYSWGNKNCYLVAGCTESEDCYYCYRVSKSKNVVDCYDLTRSELCYECTQGSNLYRSLYSHNCHDSSELVNCRDCRGCRNCINCTGLRNAQFCFENRQLTEIEYRALLQSDSKTATQPPAETSQSSRRAPVLINCENASGNYLINCCDCDCVFSLKESRDCLYCGTGENNRDIMDCNFSDHCELQYYSTNLTQNYGIIFAALVWFSSSGAYLTNCFHSKNLFGCTGMKRNQFCVLNRQYTESEYNQLVPRVIAHMGETKEWGCFFPGTISPFPYNVSLAQEYYPLSEEQARQRGLRWETEISVSTADTGFKFSDIERCASTGKPFRYIEQELEFYRELGISPPRLCPEERHRRRMLPVRRPLANLV